MNEFIITEIKEMQERSFVNADICYNHGMYSPHVAQEVHPTVEITIRPTHPDSTLLRKISRIFQDQRSITVNDTQYSKHMEPFKGEFMEFMMENYPEKIIANSEEWQYLKEMGW